MLSLSWWWFDWVAAAMSGLSLWFALGVFALATTLHLLAHHGIHDDVVPGARRLAKIAGYLGCLGWVAIRLSSSDAAVAQSDLLAFSPATGKVEAVGGLVVRPIDAHRLLVADLDGRPAWRWTIMFPVTAEDGISAPPRWREQLASGPHQHRSDLDGKYYRLAAAQTRDAARANAQARRLQAIAQDHETNAEVLRRNYMAGSPPGLVAAAAQRELSEVVKTVSANRELPAEEALSRSLISARLENVRNLLEALVRRG